MEQSTKILYISSVEDKNLSLFREIAKSFCCKVKFIILGQKEKDFKNDNEFETSYIDIPPENSHIYNLNSEYFKLVKNKIENEITKFKPDLIHTSVFSGACVDNYSIPVIVSLQEEFVSKLFWLRNDIKRYKIDIYKKLADYALNSASLVTVPSKFLGGLLAKVYKFQSPLKIVYNGVSEIKEIQAPDKPFIVTKIDQNDRDKLFLLKNLAGKLPPNVKINVIGQNMFTGNIKNIEFIAENRKEDISEILEKSSIYLSLCDYDTTGFQEIMAAMKGCAVVANDTLISREMWGDCGCIFEYNNLNSLIRVVNNLIENPPRLVQHIKSCRLKALTDFNSKNTVLEYLNIYKTLLNKGSKRVLSKIKEG